MGVFSENYNSHGKMYVLEILSCSGPSGSNLIIMLLLSACSLKRDCFMKS